MTPYSVRRASLTFGCEVGFSCWRSFPRHPFSNLQARQIPTSFNGFSCRCWPDYNSVEKHSHYRFLTSFCLCPTQSDSLYVPSTEVQRLVQLSAAQSLSACRLSTSADRVSVGDPPLEYCSFIPSSPVTFHYKSRL